MASDVDVIGMLDFLERRVRFLENTVRDVVVREFAREHPRPPDPEPVPAPAPVFVADPVPVADPVALAVFVPDRVLVAAVAERAAPQPSWEEWIGKRWTTWLGALAFVVAAGLFVDVAMDRGWLGPAARTLLAAAFGGALVVTGELARRRAMRALAQGLVGGGIAILYLAAAVGHGLYDLYPGGLAFAMLVAVAFGGMTVAVRHDTPALAHLAVLGALLAPVVVSTGEDRRDELCTYLAILDIGVLAVAYRKQWRGLDAIALLGTWSLFAGWYVEHGVGAARAPTLAWLFGFLAIFVALPFVYHLRRRMPLDLARFLGALASALVMYAFSAVILAGRRDDLALVSVALALGYLALGAVARRRIPDDARAAFGFLTLSTMAATVAIGLACGGFGTVLGWAAEGPVLVALGYRYRYAPARGGGALALVLATIRLVAAGWPPLSEQHVQPFGSPGFFTALGIVAATAVYALVHHRNRALANDVDRGFARVAALGSGLAAALACSIELLRVDSQPPIFVAPWLVAAVGYVVAGRGLANAGARGVSIACLGIATLCALAGLDHARPDDVMFANARFLAAAAVLGATLVIARAIATVSESERQLATMLRWFALAGLWLLATIEVTRFDSEPVALSVTWAAFAVAFVVAGFARHVRALRLCGLGLLGLTVGKLVLVDLAALDQLARVVSFAAAGAVMIGVSFAYHRVDRSLRARE